MCVFTPGLIVLHEKGMDEISFAGLPGSHLFLLWTGSGFCVSPGHLFNGQMDSDVKAEEKDFLCNRKPPPKSVPGA